LGGPVGGAEGNPASSHPRLDLGRPDAGRGHQFVLDPSDPAGGNLEPDPLLSILVLISVPLGVWRAHRHQVRDHRLIMISVFSGALVIAGLFTLLPGRIMHAVVFGD
jgi:hypothetical protein